MMETYFNYIVESGISLCIFTLVYWILIRKEVLLKASRCYLLVAVLFSTLLPFISINLNSFKPAETAVTVTEEVVLETNLLETITVYASGIPAKVGQAIISIKPSVWFYIVGATLTLFFILSGIAQLFSMIARNRSFKLRLARLVITRKTISPYSFFNFIFIGRDLPEQENWKTMVHHELEHVKQGHSFDVLFIDFMMVFQWFNPFYWIIRRLVRENHEFLADRAVLRNGRISAGKYKALLLSQAIGGRAVMTSNFLNVKTIQKRFKMITKNNSRKYGFLKYTLGVLTALSISMCFAVGNSEPEIKTNLIIKGEAPLNEKKLIESEKIDSLKDSNMEFFIVVEDMPEFPGGQEALRKFIAENIRYPEMAAYDKIQGKVYVQFVVNKVGKVENARIARGVDSLLNEEALRVVNLLPTWKPGRQRGEAVKVSYTVPIKFELKDEPKKIDETVVVGYEKGEIIQKDTIYNECDEMPVFEGGDLGLRKWIANNVKYPVEAAKYKEQGKVYVTFVVAKDGSVEKVKVVKGISPALDNEAVRVISLMPKWTPGKNKGEPVTVKYTIPVNFQLQ